VKDEDMPPARLCRTAPLLLLLLLGLPLMARAAVAAPPPFPQARQLDYKLPADYPRRWWVPESLRCTYLVQEPLALRDKADTPIFIYMHMAGQHQEQGMGLSVGPSDPWRVCWDCLRKLTSDLGWIYVCPEFHEFDHLLQDLRRRYGKRPIYIAGAALGGREVLQDIKDHLRDDPARYAGVALLGPAVDMRFYPNDEGFADITRATFPMPVYLLAGADDGPVASATVRLYGILRDQGTPVKLVILSGQEQGGAVVGSDWQNILSFLTSAGPGRHECQVWYPPSARASQALPTQVAFDPADGRTGRSGGPHAVFPVAPEPKLVTYAAGTAGASYWVVEPLFPDRAGPGGGVVIFIDGDEPNRMQGLGYYGGEYDPTSKDRAASARWQQLAVTLNDRGWLYVLPRKRGPDGLLEDLEQRYGRRPTYMIAVAEGAQTALAEARQHPGRYAGIMLMQPVLGDKAAGLAGAPSLPPIYITARAANDDPVTQQCRKLAEALKAAGVPVKLVEAVRPPRSRAVEGTDWADVLAFLAAPHPATP
jgi:predicted esterase